MTSIQENLENQRVVCPTCGEEKLNHAMDNCIFDWHKKSYSVFFRCLSCYTEFSKIYATKYKMEQAMKTYSPWRHKPIRDAMDFDPSLPSVREFRFSSKANRYVEISK